jgi:hypothetical protein
LEELAPSLRANGSRERAPDDRLREAIQEPKKEDWIASSHPPSPEGGLLDVLEGGLTRENKSSPALGERHAAGGAVDEPQIETLLDAAQGVTQRRGDTPSSTAAGRKLREDW